MKKLTSILCVAMLAFAANAKADTMVIPVNTTWTSLTTISIDFDFPSDVESIKSITIGLSHTFQSDLTIDVSGPGGNYNLLAAQGGGQDLGIAGTGLAGDEADYAFVESGGDPAGVLGLGGGLNDANSWGTGGPGAGWNVTIVDDFAGDGGSVTNVTIDFNTNAIPEPASMMLLVGLGTAVLGRRRR